MATQELVRPTDDSQLRVRPATRPDSRPATVPAPRPAPEAPPARPTGPVKQRPVRRPVAPPRPERPYPLGQASAREQRAPSVRVGATLEARTTTYRVVERPVEGSTRVRRELAPVAPRSGVRLTRRGRLLLSATVLVLLVLGVVMLRPGGPAFAGDSDRGPATRTVVVQQGETLWQIARDVRPGADPRETVRRIQELNGLTTAQVWAGQPLVVPS